MKANETASDDGSTTSSQPTPPEYPSPPPPSNSPPDSMVSLQADSPILDERDTGGTEGGTGPGSSGSSGSHVGFRNPGGHRIGRLVPMRSPDGEQYVEVAEGVFVPISGYKGWVVQNGYQRVPWEGPLPPQPQSILFVHVNEGEMLSFLSRDDDEPCGSEFLIKTNESIDIVRHVICQPHPHSDIFSKLSEPIDEPIISQSVTFSIPLTIVLLYSQKRRSLLCVDPLTPQVLGASCVPTPPLRASISRILSAAKHFTGRHRGYLFWYEADLPRQHSTRFFPHSLSVFSVISHRSPSSLHNHFSISARFPVLVDFVLHFFVFLFFPTSTASSRVQFI